MPHKIRRVLRAFASTPWFIEPRMAERIVALLEYRSTNGPRADRAVEHRPSAEGYGPGPSPASPDRIAIIPMTGIVTPRGLGVADICDIPPAAVSLTSFQTTFRKLADDPNVEAIVLEWYSPGGMIDLVPETAAMIRSARRKGRPIISVVNTLCASAAYWIASASDEIVVTPSGEVGSIGVYMMHQDISEALAAAGVKNTFIKEGPRKVEGNPFEPLDDTARAALQETVRHYYEMFVADVAKYRGVSKAIVRADPEAAEQHFGGGRTYPAQKAVALGMADRVDTLDNVLAGLRSGASAGAAKPGRRAEMARRRLAMI